MNEMTPPALTPKDYATDQEVRWCPGCGDYAILKAVLKTLADLQALGCRTSVDDFGTGYSSLQYLQRLPIDEVKIDRSFVADVLSNENSAAIVRSVTTLIRDLGHEVVAEGVEDAETLELLRSFGCDVIQGYHISRPMPVDDFRSWMARSRGARRPKADTHRSGGTRTAGG